MYDERKKKWYDIQYIKYFPVLALKQCDRYMVFFVFFSHICKSRSESESGTKAAKVRAVYKCVLPNAIIIRV